MSYSPWSILDSSGFRLVSTGKYTVNSNVYIFYNNIFITNPNGSEKYYLQPSKSPLDNTADFIAKGTILYLNPAIKQSFKIILYTTDRETATRTVLTDTDSALASAQFIESSFNQTYITDIYNTEMVDASYNDIEIKAREAYNIALRDKTNKDNLYEAYNLCNDWVNAADQVNDKVNEAVVLIQNSIVDNKNVVDKINISRINSAVSSTNLAKTHLANVESFYSKAQTKIFQEQQILDTCGSLIQTALNHKISAEHHHDVLQSLIALDHKNHIA